MKQSYPMDVAPGLSIDFEALLAPVPGGDGAGAGVSLRYEPVFQQIRDARIHDDATLPMGDWERPLVKADWKRVAALSGEALATRSKDFQLAAWLCEAWTHLHGVEGMAAGTRLLTALAQRYWAGAWPALEDGDADARVAPFVWLNDTLPLALTLHVPLLTIDGREPAHVNLEEWQRVVMDGGDVKAAGLTYDLLDKHVTRGGNLAALILLHRQLEAARPAWDTLRHLLDELLQGESPHLARVDDVLTRLTRAVTSLLGNHVPQAAVADASPDNLAGASSAPSHPASMDTAMSNVTLESPVPAVAARSLPTRVVSRAQAYQLIELAASYLSEHEPHSPTPYLLRRAVMWGTLSLPELMREVMRTEGDASRFFAMLGLE